MPEQNAKALNVANTPFHVDRHKHADPNRLPDTVVPTVVEKNRKNQMKDCPETTVLMRLSQFHEEELFNLASDFDSVHDVQYVLFRWFAFHAALETMPTDANTKDSWRAFKEKALSNAWATVDRKYKLLPDHFLHISDANHDRTDKTLSKVDGSFIHDLDKDCIEPKYPNWPNMSFLLEFKAGGSDKDPFDDSLLYGPDASAETRIKVRGQLMSYAERLFSYQHRTAVFFLLVNSDMFRVMRWDRSGVVVTEAVDYVSTVHGMKALLEVLYAFAKLSRAGQGVDTSAVRLVEGSCGWTRMDLLAEPNSDDLDSAEGLIHGSVHEVFKKPDSKYGSLDHDRRAHLHRDPTCSCSGHRKTPPVIPVLSHIRQLFRDSLVNGFPRYRLLVDGEEYLVGKYIFLGFGMVGRGTRGYIALEWKTQRLVFLKDSWRPAYKEVEREGDILSKLNANGVENIPTVVRYGDVSHTEDGWGVQETETSLFHPDRGKKKVDTTRPPFEETVPQPSEVMRKLMHWVKNVACKPGKTKSETIDMEKLAASWPQYKPSIEADMLRWYSSSSYVPPVGPVCHRSAPNLPAFDPSTNTPEDPAPRTGERGTKRSYDTFLGGDVRMGEGLRHMIHTRLVVREVCLPLTAFTSSRQFVRILHECICAHASAYTKCGYTHRDISAGNMLICPEVGRLPDGRWGIYWTGMLADWELAKHSSQTYARQPQRTGTWHFMSAFLLLNPTVPTTIADELESFCHVLVYGCIRRVMSSLETIDEFLLDYFAGGSFDPDYGQAACPAAKRESVVIGQTLSFTTRAVVFSTPNGEIAQDHPLNKLIAELLAIFHSRYEIAKWENAPKASAPQPPKASTTQKTALPPMWNWKAGKSRPQTVSGAASAPKREPSVVIRPLEPPTPEQYDHLASLETHAAIEQIFHTYAHSEDIQWPADDVVPDRQGKQRPPRRVPVYRADPTGDSDQSEDVLIPDAVENDESKAGPSAADMPEAVRSDHKAEAAAEETEQLVPDEPIVRPAKRRRNEPVAADLPIARITRSRAAAAAAAAAAVPAAVAPSPIPVATVAQASMRITRSKTGKLPQNNTAVARAGASTSRRPTTRRGGKTRQAAATTNRTRAASGPMTRRRAAARQTTPK